MTSVELGKGILGELYPPPPPAYFTSPIAFGEIVHHRPPGADPVWTRARHIEVMEDAILRTINKRNGRLAIAVSVRHGKALDVETPIATPAGFVPIGELVEGDEVFDEQGRVCRVVRAHDPYWSEETFEVRFKDGEVLVADTPHQWNGYTYAESQRLGARRRSAGEAHRSWPVDWATETTTRTTAEVAEAGRFYIPSTLAVNLPIATLPIDPYVLGVWLGDGASLQNTITCHSDDELFLRAQFTDAGHATADHANGFKVDPTGKGCTSPFAASLRALGVWGVKHVPDSYLWASPGQRLALLQGLMDSDGGVERSKRNTGRVSFCNQRKELADAVALLLSSLGAKVTRDERPARLNGKETGKTAYRVSSSPPFNPFRLPRKAEQWSDDSKGSLSRRTRVVESVRPLGGGRLVRCISVDSPSHLYLAGETMVPTHNSMFGSRIVPAWYLGTHPEKRVMLAGHEADFAARHGRAARDMLTHHGPSLFKVSVSQTSQAANRWDIHAHEGGMLTLGVGGSPIGRGGDVVIVDDPYRNYADAMNPRVRKEVAEWWSGTMVSRIEPGGAVIIIMARWHTDDLIGVLTREQPDMWELLTMPALCTDPENDPLGRAFDEPLWPERYDRPDIEVAAAGMVAEHGDAVYEAQFQQNPQAADGDFFDEDAWTYYNEPPQCDRLVRAWDLAASTGKGDWTVGLLLGKVKESQRYAVLDVVRKRVGPDGVRKAVLDTAARDKARYGGGVIVNIPQDPAQAGKDQAQQYVTMLQGFHVRTTPTTTAKTVKASGVASQQRVGNIMLPRDRAALIDGGAKGETVAWVGPLVAETTQFDNGTFDDQVDALSDAYNRIAQPGSRLLV